jgi:ABC-type sugar transport system permease subunit
LGGTFWTVYLICIFVFIFFPLYYLYNFSIKTIRAINSTSTKNLTEGLKNLKSLFKFYGVFVATIVGFYLVIIVGGLLSTAVF